MPIFLFLALLIININYSFSLCSNNTNFCIYCNNFTDLCAKCQISDILIPDEEGGCKGAKKCIPGKNYCKECDINGKLCKKCEDYFQPDENGGCAYTKGCEISYMGQCLKCSKNFLLTGNQIRICISLSLEKYKHCKIINDATGNCMNCEDGYELQLKDYKCTKLNHCEESIFNNCISCDPTYNYNMKEDKCVMKELDLTYCKISIDGKNCDICDNDYYFDDTGICMSSPFCSESFYFKCTKCKPGYFLSTFNICTTTNNCYEVDKITFLCTSCQTNYYLNTKDYKCNSNLEDGPYKYCKVVDNDKCVQCEYGYHLTENFKCSNSRYCSESENGKCLNCSKNYYLGLDHICTDVEGCIYSKDGICTECEEGYYYHTFNNTCIEMEGIFLGCKYTCTLGDKCCECKDDYYLYLNDSLCYDNSKEEPFIKCAIVDYDRDKCKFCLDGYYLGQDDDKCCKVENCRIVENENKCKECNKYYCLDVKNQECVYNDFLYDINDKIFISCIRTNDKGTACEKCEEGYKINEEGYCVDVDYCEEKKDGKCLKCKDIIVNNYSLCANELFGCIISAEDNCLRCDNLEDLYECTECKEGYIKTDFRCEKNES